MAHEKSVIISHRRDFDGIACAAELLRLLDGSVEKILFTNPNSAEILSTISCIKGLKDSVIYITDISLSDDSYSSVISALGEIHSKNNQIKWLDHHPWPEDGIKSMKEISDMLICGENKEYCAAELVYANLCRNDDTCKTIARLAHLTDFNIRPEDKELDADLVKISQCIAFLDNTDADSEKLRKSLVENVAMGSLKGKIVDEIYSQYKKSEAKNIALLETTMGSIRLGKYVLGIAFAENLQSNMACAMIKKETSANIQVFVTTKDWSAHVRSDDGVDSSLLSKRLGGNGHPQASGFTLKISNPKMEEAIKEYTENVFKAAKEIFG
ncbi:MAG: hypothetical protein M1465_00080 [Candidatus Marsarchaeota archaeon]|jgi:oligoribonuclease NrnB/cAMP/cGMP phosphodiesterase (DHH superfamily)|nr:hypothetical protein [Candidatus Marsarchaeota archaeon]